MAVLTNQKPERTTALVTGASGGIGSAIALRLAEEGLNVALHYNSNKPEQTIEFNQYYKNQFECFPADFSNTGFECELLDAIEQHFSKATILINCAANQDIGEMHAMHNSQFEQMLHTNVSAVFALSREFANRLTAPLATDASIVNISSIEAARPAPGHGHYATSKAALEMLTKAMALEYGTKGLRVNAIAPGLISRPGIENDWPDGVSRWNNACPLGRLGTAEDIANAVAFLVSDQAAFINGTIITIDGGMSTTPGW